MQKILNLKTKYFIIQLGCCSIDSWSSPSISPSLSLCLSHEPCQHNILQNSLVSVGYKHYRAYRTNNVLLFYNCCAKFTIARNLLRFFAHFSLSAQVQRQHPFAPMHFDLVLFHQHRLLMAVVIRVHHRCHRHPVNQAHLLFYLATNWRNWPTHLHHPGRLALILAPSEIDRNYSSENKLTVYSLKEIKIERRHTEVRGIDGGVRIGDSPLVWVWPCISACCWRAKNCCSSSVCTSDSRFETA